MRIAAIIVIIAVALLTIGMVRALNHTNNSMNASDLETDTPDGIEQGWAETIQDEGYYLNINDTVGDEDVQDSRRTTTDSVSSAVTLLTAPDPNSNLTQGAQAIDYDGDGIGTIVIYFESTGIRPATANEIEDLDLN